MYSRQISFQVGMPWSGKVGHPLFIKKYPVSSLKKKKKKKIHDLLTHDQANMFNNKHIAYALSKINNLTQFMCRIQNNW